MGQSYRIMPVNRAHRSFRTGRHLPVEPVGWVSAFREASSVLNQWQYGSGDESGVL
jgi:hypothetical protein